MNDTPETKQPCTTRIDANDVGCALAAQRFEVPDRGVTSATYDGLRQSRYPLFN